MDQLKAFYSAGAAGAMLSGPLLFVAHLLIEGGRSPHPSVTGSTLVFAAHLLSLFAFAGLYPVPHVKTGWVRLLGMLLSISGTVTVCAVVFIEIAAAAGSNVESVLERGPVSIIAGIGPLVFVVGTLLFSLSEMMSGAISRFGGSLLLTGTVLFAAGSIAGALEGIFSLAGAGVTGAGLFWLGAVRLRDLGSLNLF